MEDNTKIIGRKAEQEILYECFKYASSEYAIDKAYDLNLRNKREAFLAETHTRKAAQTTMITTYGLRKNAYRAGIPFEVSLDDLFV